jgi:hypothetical protein
MSKPFARTVLFATLALALLAALPALAGEAPQPAVARVAAPVASPLTPSCKLDVPPAFASPAPAISAQPLPEWLDGGLSTVLTKKFHGFCHCGCVNVPNCNTDADCGGSTCGTTISCC